MEVDMALAWSERVRHIRHTMGYTQAEFAARLGISPKTVEAWERMYRRPYSAQAEFFQKVEEVFRDGELPLLGPDDDATWREILEEEGRL